ncbi:MAG: phosphoribosylanthranilate isomerase [Bacteroidia bacterium]|nr:phosphoribosylanthranilate isomerase [Bacteroidia bacterium]
MIAGKVIKVCGMRQEENIREIEALGVDWMGFIFYPHSKRYVAQPLDYLPTNVRRVGVFVDEEFATVKELIKAFKLDLVQLHGHESAHFCELIREQGVEVIKAFAIAEPEDFKATKEYETHCDYLLFDAKTPLYGGSGKQFDWSMLANYTGECPFLLSGGITPQSAEALSVISHPLLMGYDLNSGFESQPGLKESCSIRLFLTQLIQLTQ